MAAKFLIVAFVAISATHIQASSYSTIASTYNAHTINHAVAYPAGPKVIPAAPPAVISSPVPASPLPAAVATTAVSATPAAALKPAIFETSAAAHSPAASIAPQVPFAAPGHITFAPATFGFGAPSKVGFSAAPAYPKDPILAAGFAYEPSYGAVHAYAPAYSAAPAFAASSAAFATPAHAFATAPAAYPVAPAYAGSAPAYAFPAAYTTGSVAFTSAAPVSGPIPAAALASVHNTAISAKHPVPASPYAYW